MESYEDRSIRLKMEKIDGLYHTIWKIGIFKENMPFLSLEWKKSIWIEK